jgi:hypothetical protein
LSLRITRSFIVCFVNEVPWFIQALIFKLFFQYQWTVMIMSLGGLVTCDTKFVKSQPKPRILIGSSQCTIPKSIFEEEVDSNFFHIAIFFILNDYRPIHAKLIFPCCRMITDSQKVRWTWFISFIAHGIHVLNPFIHHEISPTYHS